MVPCKSTAEEGSIEWSHHRILSRDSKVRTALHVSIVDSGSERVKHKVRSQPVCHFVGKMQWLMLIVLKTPQNVFQPDQPPTWKT